MIAAAKRGTVKFGAVNLFDLRWVAFSGITFSDRFDLFHCESCRHVLLTKSRLAGSPDAAAREHQDQPVPPHRHHRQRRLGAGDNAIDFVAVQYARVTGNVIERAGDWCIYAKGGSAFVTVAEQPDPRLRNGRLHGRPGHRLPVHDRAVHPLRGLRHPACSTTRSRDIEGAGVGVNGGYNVVVARNRMWNVGSRSHWIEVGYGSRSCDGQPGDEGRDAASRTSTPAAGAPPAWTTAPTTSASPTATSADRQRRRQPARARATRSSASRSRTRRLPGRLGPGRRAGRRRPARSPAT